MANPNLSGDLLHIRYVPLAQAKYWDRNPKKHDSDQLIISILRHGFRDAPIYDETLNAISAGNGRTTAVDAIKNDPERVRRLVPDWDGEPPAGIAVDKQGDWYVPMQFGVNAESIAAAEAFAVAHNNLTMAGGSFSFLEIARMWDADVYSDLLFELRQEGELPVGVESSDVDDLLRSLELPDEFPEYDDDVADEVEMTTCPSCGHQFAS